MCFLCPTVVEMCARTIGTVRLQILLRLDLTSILQQHFFRATARRCLKMVLTSNGTATVGWNILSCESLLFNVQQPLDQTIHPDLYAQ